MRISQRPLACYVMALSRQTARTFPGHRTSINYRSFHEQLHRFSKLPVFARYIAEKSQIWKNVWICRRKIVGSAEISFENRSIEPIFLFFFLSARWNGFQFVRTRIEYITTRIQNQFKIVRNFCFKDGEDEIHRRCFEIIVAFQREWARYLRIIYWAQLRETRI